MEIVRVELTEKEMELISTWLGVQGWEDTFKIIDNYKLPIDADLTEDALYEVYKACRCLRPIELTREQADLVNVWLGHQSIEDTRFIIERNNLDLDTYKTEHAFFVLYEELGGYKVTDRVLDIL